ncbi:MAG: DUF2851 family protein [Lentisphaeria bacterium]|nr:DUF2851 family protein [Lentisphaeria bacterium]
MQTEKTNISDSFRIRDPEAVYEAEFQSRWDALSDGAVLTDTEGNRIQILSRGEWNHEAGPDFRNARILLHGQVIRGDIELHRKTSDYIRHGHLADAAYGNVILHVVEDDDLAGNGGEGALAHIPVCRISPQSLIRRAGSACRCRIFPYMCEPQLEQFFTDAGLERLLFKSSAVLEELIRSGTGPAFRRALFRAAGYKRNQEAFLELFRRLETYPPEVFAEHFEALLWGESSLLPDPANTDLSKEVRREIRRLWDEFWAFRPEARGPIQWKRDAVRPLNSPERRIAMLAAFIREFTPDPLPGLAASLASEPPEQFLKTLRKRLNFTDPFWDRHCSFHTPELTRRAAVLGADRAETLLIDVFTPALWAYARLEPGRLPENTVRSLPLLIGARKDNRVFKNAIRRWLPENDPRAAVFKHAAAVQGCLHIYRHYCAAAGHDCSSCLLADSAV